LTFIGLWRAFGDHSSEVALYAAVLLSFPLIYYVTHVEVYYRRQIDPMMVVLAVYATVTMRGKRVETGEQEKQELEPVHQI